MTFSPKDVAQKTLWTVPPVREIPQKLRANQCGSQKAALIVKFNIERGVSLFRICDSGPFEDDTDASGALVDGP